MLSFKPKKKATFSVKDIATLALVTAFCVVGRLAFVTIPNVQPMTTIFLLITIYRGIPQGLIVSLLSVLISNLYLGMGPWTINQLVSYAVIICLAGLLAHWSIFKNQLLLQALFSFLAGFLYGLIISLISYKLFGMTAFFPYYLQGLSFDLLHASGNLGFYLILGPLLKKILQSHQSN